MDLNALQDTARKGDAAAEELLFQNLSARFVYFAKQKIWSEEDAEEIAQNALMTVLKKYCPQLTGVLFRLSIGVKD